MEEEFNIDIDEEEEVPIPPMELYEEIDYIIQTYYTDQVNDIVEGRRDSIRVNFQLLSASAKEELNTNYTEYMNREDSIVYIPTKHVNDRGREIEDFEPCEKVTLEFEGVSPKFTMTQLGSANINGLMQINGVATSISEPRSIMDVAMYRCKCGSERAFKQYIAERTKPSECFICGSKRPMWVLLEADCIWDDYQEVVVQENPEVVESGGIPRTMTLRLKGRQLLNVCKPGDITDITGVLMPVDLKKGRIFGWVVEVNHVDVLTKDTFNVELTKEDIIKIEELASDKKILDLLIESVFPSIHGHIDIKKGIILALFSGVNRKRKDSTQRGTINLLMVGDPGTAKSRMLVAAKNAAPKAVYTSGRGSSAAGLTAAAIQDKMGWRLEAGTLVLADRGIACIDEIEKMTEQDRSSIHDAMALQIVAVDKANIHTTLNARTGVIAAGNPKDGRYDRTEFVTENINLSPPILSRFDLIYIIQDVPDTENDKRIADKVLDIEDLDNRLLSHDLIKKYILYSKRFKPSLSPEAKAIIVDYYIPLREKSGEQEGAMFISTRQLEGLRRLSEAGARMRLSNSVSAIDAIQAIDLLRACLAEAWYDPFGDQIDVSAMETGKTKSETDAKTVIESIIKDAGTNPMHFDAIVDRASDYNIPRNKVFKLISALMSTGYVYMPESDKYKHTSNM